MRRASISVILVAGLAGAPAHAQTVAPIPSTVEAAEAEGAKHPKTTGVNAHPMYPEAFGPRDRTCVDVNVSKSVAVRSGDFVAGPFDRRVMMGPPGPNQKRKTWWAPHPEPNSSSILQVRAVKRGTPDVTETFTFTSAGRNPWFFPSRIRFREAGDWLVIVTSGESWGCFLLDEIDLPKP